MLSADSPRLSAWWSIWTQPRVTMQRIVERDARRGVVALAGLAGFHEALNRVSIRSAGDHLDLSVMLLAVAIAGPLVGIFSLYVGAAILSWTGKWIGGNAPVLNIRAAIAWSSVPFILALVLWVPQVLLFGREMFRTETPRMDASPNLVLAFAVIGIGVGIWHVVVFLKCLGQVQGFSAWRALTNAFLGGLVVIAALFAVIGGWSWLD